jgi:hypothetical protein
MVSKTSQVTTEIHIFTNRRATDGPRFIIQRELQESQTHPEAETFSTLFTLPHY